MKGHFVPHTQETKDKIRAKLLGRPTGRKGIPLSEETKKKLSEWGKKNPVSHWLGKKRPPFSEEAKKNMGKAREGKHHSEETKHKISEAHKKIGTPWLTGKHQTEETKRKISIGHGGRGILNDHRRGSGKNKEWITKVFKRDNWTCQNCNRRSEEGKPLRLNAHHIKQWANYPDDRFDVNNGVTLCEYCHFLVHGKKLKARDAYQLMQKI